MKPRSVIWAVIFSAAVSFGPMVHAQLTEPLRMGNVRALTDAFDRKLDGPAYPSHARIDVFVSAAIGRPSTFLTNTYVGANTSPGKGYFFLTIPNRPTGRVVVVAYDAATSNEASYYRSASAPIPDSGRLLLDFGDLRPMAKFNGDADAAYADALERLHASGIDSDNDGMTDWEEALAGTDIENDASLMAFESIESPAPADSTRSATGEESEVSPTLVVVQWQSVPGRTYQLQYAPSLLPDPETGEVLWQDVGDTITAETDETSIRVEVELENPEASLGGHFRLKLVL